MALKQIQEKSKDRETCPRCGGMALIIDGSYIKWLTCTKCKFKKIMEKREKPIEVVPLIEHKEEDKSPNTLKVEIED